MVSHGSRRISFESDALDQDVLAFVDEHLLSDRLFFLPVPLLLLLSVEVIKRTPFIHDGKRIAPLQAPFRIPIYIATYRAYTRHPHHSASPRQIFCLFHMKKAALQKMQYG